MPLVKYQDAIRNNQADIKGSIVKILLKLDLSQHKCKLTRVYFTDQPHQINCHVQYDDLFHRTITEQIIREKLREQLTKLGYAIDDADFQLTKVSIAPQCIQDDFNDD